MNKYNPYKHHRRSIRLQGYDYSQEGLYFITICCQDRACLFGEIVDGEMICNDAGNIANQCWLDIPNHFPNMVLHEYVVMPNHIHGIVEIIGTDNVGANDYSPYNNVMANDDVGTKNISPYNNVMANDDVGAKDISPYNNVMANDDVGAKNISPYNNVMANDDVGAKNISPYNNVMANDDVGANDYSPYNNVMANDDGIGANDYSPIPPNGTSKTIGSMVRGFKIGVRSEERRVGKECRSRWGG